VDIQDASVGTRHVRLASLLRDAYADFDENEVDGLFAQYSRELPWSGGIEALRARFDIVAPKE
jgi:aminoglycoside/choline kinase family phosphotransferase